MGVESQGRILYFACSMAQAQINTCYCHLDLLCSDQFSLEDDLILSQIADMAEDDTDQIMCSQVQTLETQYWNDIR